MFLSGPLALIIVAAVLLAGALAGAAIGWLAARVLGHPARRIAVDALLGALAFLRTRLTPVTSHDHRLAEWLIRSRSTAPSAFTSSR
jgi:hypothetical protein